MADECRLCGFENSTAHLVSDYRQDEKRVRTHQEHQLPELGKGTVGLAPEKVSVTIGSGWFLMSPSVPSVETTHLLEHGWLRKATGLE